MFIVHDRALAVIATLSFALSFAAWGRLAADSSARAAPPARDAAAPWQARAPAPLPGPA
jgi:hypothetical protein